MIGSRISDLIDDRTKLVLVESPGSGTMEVQDVPAIVQAAKAKGALVACDNTWASPLLFKPLARGADFACEALTKYVGGHSDLLLGSITVNNIGLRQKVRDVLRLLGIGVSPDEATLALRGIETMGVRLAHMGRVSEDFARRLKSSPAIVRVLHPCLTDCPGHETWKRDFKGSSGVFSVALVPEVGRNLNAALGVLRVFAIGASWGGTRSLIAPMAIAEERTIANWRSDELVIRVSIGLEDPADLWSDLSAFLQALMHRAA